VGSDDVVGAAVLLLCACLLRPQQWELEVAGLDSNDIWTPVCRLSGHGCENLYSGAVKVNAAIRNDLHFAGRGHNARERNDLETGCFDSR